MSRVAAVVADVALYATGGIIALSLYSFASGAATFIPNWDLALRPVVAFGYVDRATGHEQAPVQNIKRTAEHVCWSLFIEKLSSARVKSYDFSMLSGDLSTQIPTSAYLVNEDDTPRGDQALETHPVGEQWHRRYCVDVAGRVPDFRSITIQGWAHHERWPHLWALNTRVPSFTEGPLKP